MRHTNVTLKDINIVRGVEPDTDNGGRLIDGVIIGPKIPVNRWRIKDEPRLFFDRKEAEIEVKRRSFNEEVFKALDLDMVRGQALKVSDVVQLIKQHGTSLKKVLTNKTYASVLK